MPQCYQTPGENDQGIRAGWSVTEGRGLVYVGRIAWWPRRGTVEKTESMTALDWLYVQEVLIASAPIPLDPLKQSQTERQRSSLP
jgi:hypothetical protein